MHSFPDRNALAAGILLALAATPALAEEPATTPAAEAEAEATFQVPGLPEGLNWTFNFDASAGTFGFADSLYTNPKPEQPSGDLSDNWSEASVKPALSAEYTTSSSSQIYGKFSAVGVRTFGAAPSLVGDDASSFDIEDAYIGWRSGTSIDGLGENVLDFTVGRTQYKVGHGLLLADGSGDGGSRGGYWTGARKAFEFAAIGRFKPGNHTFEAFYLDKDDMPEADSDSKLWGAELRVRDRRGHDARRDVHEVVRRRRRGAAARRARCLQPAGFHGTVLRPEGTFLRGGVRHRGQRRCARFHRVERAGCIPVRLELAAQAFLSLCHLRRRRSRNRRRTRPSTGC